MRTAPAASLRASCTVRFAAWPPGPPKTRAPYVLIIDEINRANLAKVFGELYFLLEYRGTSVALQYSEEPFACRATSSSSAR